MKPLTMAQRRVLRALVAAGGAKPMVGGEFPEKTVLVLEERALVTVERPVGAPTVVHLTDAGRAAERFDRTGVRP